MYIAFEKVIIHNFLSYGHSEINLKDKSYCLVRGVNNNPLDNALSNGAGKSSWSSAICWCLTGETINGLKSGLKNIFIDEKECYVTLYFSVDNDKFEVTRYVEPKSDLRLIVNGEDKSGKGIRETSIVLAEYLPDLTSQLLGSVIILGQGLPCKFTANTPSGRKDVLEKLSKSDFMIQDIKNKLAKVLDENNKELRSYEDELIKKESEKNIYTTQKTANLEKLAELEKPVNFESLIKDLNDNIVKEENLLKTTEQTLNESVKQLEEVGKHINELTEYKNKSIIAENEKYSKSKLELVNKNSEISTDYTTAVSKLQLDYNTAKADITNKNLSEEVKLQSSITTLENEIKKLDAITDICPTCGQKLVGITKPDTTPRKEQVKTLKDSLSTLVESKNKLLAETATTFSKTLTDLKESYTKDSNEIAKKLNGIEVLHKTSLNSIEEDFNRDVAEYNNNYKQIKDKIQLYTENKRLKESSILALKKSLTETQLQKDNHDSKLKEVKDILLSIDNNLKKINDEILYINNKKVTIENRISIDNKLNTLIKRDFRGFLLSNIINFIDKKAKEYATFIFGSDKLDFALDGNNIDISYVGKAFENLSGGEKQKVDLIIQFAIRDMMSEYLQFSSNILILDEIFDNLDSDGCNNVINLISKKLNDIESLFIISHHDAELELSYDTEMVICKDKNGISNLI